LRERFHRGDRCCDSSCGTATTAGEKIDTTPKKMPVEKDKGKDKRPQTDDARIEPQPVPFAVPVNPAIPNVEVAPAPAPAPRIEGGRRDPF
jgi:hypothetical protein